MMGYAQVKIDTLDIQKTSLRVPRSKSKIPATLATRLTAKYEDDASKSYAISYWITHRIKYDCKGYRNHRTQAYGSEKVLKKRKALCEEYSILYKEMCEAVGIQALVVAGHAKEFDFLENDTVYSSNHVWNITFIDEKWQLSDHTFAAGKVLSRKQLLKPYMCALLGIPYKPKFYFKWQYDPDWIAANPNRMIQSHFPDLQMFQLLQNPVTVSEFSKESTIEGLTPITENHLIANYIAKSFREKMIYSAQKGKETNPFNNRMAGYQHFMLVDDLLKKHYNLETKTFNLPVDELFYIKEQAFLSDSLLKLARKDNEANYQQKKRQNQQMSNKLKINNKTLVDTLQKRVRQNRKNIKTSIRLQKKSKNMLKYFDRRNVYFLSRKPLEKTKRPKLTQQTDKERINELLTKLDSIQNEVVPVQLSQIDSLNAFYTSENIIQNVLVVQTLTSKYPVLLADLKKMEKLYAMGIPLGIHKYSHYLEKRDLAKEICLLDSLKKQHIDKMMFQLRENQNAFFNQTKQYTKSTTECLTLLKSIKKMSVEQHNEDGYYAKIIADYVNNLPEFKDYAKVYQVSQKILMRNLKSQNKKMEKIISRLKNETNTENYRYQLYDGFLKGRRAGENIRVKAIQTQLNKYQTEVEKRIKIKEQEDEISN
jgi:hypothetical protein